MPLSWKSRLFMSDAHHRILVFASNVFAAEPHTRCQQGLAIARVPGETKETDMTRSQDNLANPAAADFAGLHCTCLLLTQSGHRPFQFTGLSRYDALLLALGVRE